MKHPLILILLFAVTGCSGGSGGSGGSDAPASAITEPVTSDLTFTDGLFKAASIFEASCENPRSNTNPETGAAYTDASGSILAENFWLRYWSNDLYLWYGEIVDQNPNDYLSTLDYFDVLKTNGVTSSGNLKDKFHFTYPTNEWLDLSQSGVSVSYGATFSLISSLPPRQILVAYIEPGSTADINGLSRGDRIIAVNGVDAINDNTTAGINTLNLGLFPSVNGQSNSFTIIDAGATASRKVTLTTASISTSPVLVTTTITTATGDVGYIVFNDHIATAEFDLSVAVQSLSSAGISDLVIDLRYNGGGFLALASQLAYMIAGTAPTSGKAFESLIFNDKHTTFNPITNELLQPLLFLSETIGLSSMLPAGTAVPTLNLSRVYIIAGEDTCSASEAIINSLQGIGFETILIGGTTCGKPYGFYPQDNCVTTYFSIQFAGENDIGFSAYSDGFRPSNSLSSSGVPVTGCAVADDYTHELGDPSEARLAAALSYRATGVCPAPSASGSSKSGGSEKARASEPANYSGGVVKPLWLQNRIMDIF
jgi:C-terminal processing protease CtpA/Prc